MRALILSLALAAGLMVPATAQQLSLSFAIPGVSIGINVPRYPELVRVPGYPVYYAPQLRSNYFFYDGLYWVFQGDNWYASNWYDGPWGSVGPAQVPAYVLRLPVRYYRSPPQYFRGWRRDAPPRWGEHWGPGWQQQRQGWDRWDRRAMPAPAPRPVYQRPYSGSRYPPAEQQRFLQERNYRHQPRDEFVRQPQTLPPQRVQDQRLPEQRAPDQRVPRQAPQPQPRQPPQPPHQDRGDAHRVPEADRNSGRGPPNHQELRQERGKDDARRDERRDDRRDDRGNR
ncbi:conserved exported hypothetical protein [Rubrivivax sp. A210]|uniref:hypothetical protein n=1 Tax=Rubrivivax sp. A210 TaxID=2772301 RepID=UPI00191B34D3|nr:hypothetical protein [Rubrivivax sp. A210]CAD5365899.1 conserved exported hypothetical protein [Rubrivivax sp. A210]